MGSIWKCNDTENPKKYAKDREEFRTALGMKGCLSPKWKGLLAASPESPADAQECGLAEAAPNQTPVRQKAMDYMQGPRFQAFIEYWP
jgi:hypothetical protein